MNFYTLSLFPNLINSSLEEGVIKKAINNKFINRITRLYVDGQIDIDQAVDMINQKLSQF